MRRTFTSSVILSQVSPVMEEVTGNSGGFFGFTCYFSDGRFENVIVNFDNVGRTIALMEIEAIHGRYNQLIEKGENS